MDEEKQPLISVVIPAYNEEPYISACLASLEKQDFTGKYEIIVVDNNSTDRTAQIAAQHGATVISEQRQGVAIARQTGFMHAKAPIIASTDADSIVPENWLSIIAEKFATTPSLVEFGGLYKLTSGPKTARTFFSALAPVIWKLDKIIIRNWSIPAVNMAVHKNAFEQVGGFKTKMHINEDAVLSNDLSKIGQVVLDPDFFVLTSGRRYRNGLLAGLAAYIPNTFARVMRKPEKLNAPLKSIRTEESLIKTLGKKLKKP